MAKLRVDKIASVGVSTETTGSVYFDGTSDGLRSDAYDELIIGTGAFTVECWFWRENITDSWGSLVSDNLYSGAGGWDLYTQYDDIRFYVGGVGEVFTVSDCYSAQTWTHVAAQRDSSGNMSCYINGVNQNVSASNSTDYTDNRILIGGNNSPAGSYPAYVFNGYISNVRVCRGHTVYTSNFSVPTRELEVHPGPSNDKTILLACYDGENVFAEKTGKIIAANGDRLSSPTPTVTDSPIGITTFQPGLTRDVDNTFGPVFQGGAAFTSQNWLTLPKGTTTERFPDFGAVDAASARGVFAGGYSPGETNIIDYVTISTLGDAQDFGDLTVATEYPGGTSDRTRGLTLGGQTGSDALNTVSFVTIASTGNASDFGDLTDALRQKGALANSTRAIAVGGSPTSGPFAANNVMDYFTIQSSGNALNFGDLSELTNYGNPTASSVRGVFSGMSDPNGSTTNTISYVTISTTGNAQNFGDLDFTGSGGGGLSNSTRGVIARDNNTELDFITIASLGNSQDFGTLTGNARYNTDAAVSSSTRGLFMIGAPAGNGINYITILSTGNGQDFGDLTRSPGGDAGFSNGHGGLG